MVTEKKVNEMEKQMQESQRELEQMGRDKKFIEALLLEVKALEAFPRVDGYGDRFWKENGIGERAFLESNDQWIQNCQYLEVQLSAEQKEKILRDTAFKTYLVRPSSMSGVPFETVQTFDLNKEVRYTPSFTVPRAMNSLDLYKTPDGFADLLGQKQTRVMQEESFKATLFREKHEDTYAFHLVLHSTKHGDVLIRSSDDSALRLLDEFEIIYSARNRDRVIEFYLETFNVLCRSRAGHSIVQEDGSLKKEATDADFFQHARFEVCGGIPVPKLVLVSEEATQGTSADKEKDVNALAGRYNVKIPKRPSNTPRTQIFVKFIRSTLASVSQDTYRKLNATGLVSIGTFITDNISMPVTCHKMTYDTAEIGWKIESSFMPWYQQFLKTLVECMATFFNENKDAASFNSLFWMDITDKLNEGLSKVCVQTTANIGGWSEYIEAAKEVLASDDFVVVAKDSKDVASFMKSVLDRHNGSNFREAMTKTFGNGSADDLKGFELDDRADYRMHDWLGKTSCMLPYGGGSVWVNVENLCGVAEDGTKDLMMQADYCGPCLFSNGSGLGSVKTEINVPEDVYLRGMGGKGDKQRADAKGKAVRDFFKPLLALWVMTTPSEMLEERNSHHALHGFVQQVFGETESWGCGGGCVAKTDMNMATDLYRAAISLSEEDFNQLKQPRVEQSDAGENGGGGEDMQGGPSQPNASQGSLPFIANPCMPKPKRKSKSESTVTVPYKKPDKDYLPRILRLFKVGDFKNVLNAALPENFMKVDQDYLDTHGLTVPRSEGEVKNLVDWTDAEKAHVLLEFLLLVHNSVLRVYDIQIGFVGEDLDDMNELSETLWTGVGLNADEPVEICSMRIQILLRGVTSKSTEGDHRAHNITQAVSFLNQKTRMKEDRLKFWSHQGDPRNGLELANFLNRKEFRVLGEAKTRRNIPAITEWLRTWQSKYIDSTELFEPTSKFLPPFCLRVNPTTIYNVPADQKQATADKKTKEALEKALKCMFSEKNYGSRVFFQKNVSKQAPETGFHTPTEESQGTFVCWGHLLRDDDTDYGLHAGGIVDNLARFLGVEMEKFEDVGEEGIESLKFELDLACPAATDEDTEEEDASDGSDENEPARFKDKLFYCNGEGCVKGETQCEKCVKYQDTRAKRVAKERTQRVVMKSRLVEGFDCWVFSNGTGEETLKAVLKRLFANTPELHAEEDSDCDEDDEESEGGKKKKKSKGKSVIGGEVEKPENGYVDWEDFMNVVLAVNKPCIDQKVNSNWKPNWKVQENFMLLIPFRGVRKEVSVVCEYEVGCSNSQAGPSVLRKRGRPSSSKAVDGGGKKRKCEMQYTRDGTQDKKRRGRPPKNFKAEFMNGGRVLDLNVAAPANQGNELMSTAEGRKKRQARVLDEEGSSSFQQPLGSVGENEGSRISAGMKEKIEKAQKDKMESEARTSKINEVKARLAGARQELQAAEKEEDAEEIKYWNEKVVKYKKEFRALYAEDDQ